MGSKPICAGVRKNSSHPSDHRADRRTRNDEPRTTNLEPRTQNRRTQNRRTQNVEPPGSCSTIIC
ncbi:MAG: hypothetical protein EHM55_07045 [Acidobacteria bacterium]|nr:MAG: hypothetical protein EHM55_07045 [Acidobacteriota bacterium]